MFPLLLLTAVDVDVPIRTGEVAAADAALVVAMSSPFHLPADRWAARDAEAAWSFLVHTRGVPPDRMRLLTNPTEPEVELALSEAVDRLGAGGVLWVFWSGPGARSAWDGRPLLLTAEAPADPARLDRGAIRLDTLQSSARSAGKEASTTVLVLDTSFDGIQRDGSALFPGHAWSAPIAPSATPGTLTLVGAAPGLVAEPFDDMRHGLLSFLALGGLRGWADLDHDGHVRASELTTWLPTACEALGRPADTLFIDAGDVSGISLANGRLQGEPHLQTIYLPEPSFTDAEPRAEDEAEEDADPERFASDIAEVRKQLQAAADLEWGRIHRVMARDPDEGRAAMRRFVDRFDVVEVPLLGGDAVLTAEQVSTARQILAGTTPLRPRVPTVRFEPGTFQLGPDDARRRVSLSRPWLVARDEVTQRQFTDVMGYDPAAFRDPARPVDSVSFYEAIAFCNALSRLEGLRPAYHVDGRRVTWDTAADGWRLPTEAEWEVAAGPGPWSGFADADEGCARANLLDAGSTDDPDAMPCDDHAADPVAVGRSVVSVLGLRDLTGNVAEWAWDAWERDRPAEARDPRPDHALGPRVVKGGSFRTLPSAAVTWERQAVEPQDTRDDLGFRLARFVAPANPSAHVEPITEP